MKICNLACSNWTSIFRKEILLTRWINHNWLCNKKNKNLLHFYYGMVNIPRSIWTRETKFTTYSFQFFLFFWKGGGSWHLPSKTLIKYQVTLISALRDSCMFLINIPFIKKLHKCDIKETFSWRYLPMRQKTPWWNDMQLFSKLNRNLTYSYLGVFWGHWL